MMWSFPIPFCLPLFRTGLILGLLVAVVGASLPWVIPAVSLAAIILSPRLAEWTDVARFKTSPGMARGTVAEWIARRFRRADMVRLKLAQAAAIRALFLAPAIALAAVALLADASSIAEWASGTWYWRLCYVDGPTLAGTRMVGIPDNFRPVVGDVGLLWAPLCAFVASALAVALPLWMGAMSKGFEAVQGKPTWQQFFMALGGAVFQIPLSVLAIFVGMTGFGPYPTIGDLSFCYLILPVAGGLALSRSANLGTLLAALLWKHGGRWGYEC